MDLTIPKPSSIPKDMYDILNAEAIDALAECVERDMDSVATGLIINGREFDIFVGTLTLIYFEQGLMESFIDTIKKVINENPRKDGAILHQLMPYVIIEYTDVVPSRLPTTTQKKDDRRTYNGPNDSTPRLERF